MLLCAGGDTENTMSGHFGAQQSTAIKSQSRLSRPMPNSLHVYGLSNRIQQVDHEKVAELNMRLN